MLHWQQLSVVANRQPRLLQEINDDGQIWQTPFLSANFSATSPCPLQILRLCHLRTRWHSLSGTANP
jgi:hypothetical protein